MLVCAKDWVKVEELKGNKLRGEDLWLQVGMEVSNKVKGLLIMHPTLEASISASTLPTP